MSLNQRVEHFRCWALDLVLDTGDNWELEPFQLAIVKDILAGYPEVWMVVPEGNGKTTLMAGIALYHGDTVSNPFVPIGASSREQAEIMYRQAEGFVLRSPGMTERFKCQEGYRRIKCLETVGRIQVYAADDRTADGVIPTLALLDELHRHRDLRLYRTWRGKLDKRGGQIVTISTAGEPGSEFEETRDRIRKQAKKLTTKGPFIRAQGDSVVLHDWAVRDRSKIDKMRTVAAANPRKQITAATLKRKWESPTMTPEHWMRFVCNIATRMSGQAVTPEEWDRLCEPDLTVDASIWSIGFIDLGWKIDTTAMGVVAWESDERRAIAGIKILKPPVNEADIVDGLLNLHLTYNPIGIVYDPNAGGHQMAQMLEKGEHPLQTSRKIGPLTFFEHSQDNAPMGLAAARFEEALRSGWLRHNGDVGLRAHVLNAWRRPLGGEKWKYDRPPDAKGDRRRKYPIDALTGVLMGHSVAVAEHNSEGVVAEFISLD